MTIRYVLKENASWYIARGWRVIGSFSLGGWDSYIMAKGEL
ncbi:MAG: hypothetical protein ACP5JP_02240 [bacterium]